MNSIKSILNNLHPNFDFDNSSNFIMDGFLDSFDVITLVTELEDNFQIKIDGLDILPENFSSIESIKQMLIKNGAKDEF